MGKMNRGKTTKLSIRLSREADERINTISKNVNLSKAGVILFGLTERLNLSPTKEEILNLENHVTLEPGYFSVTINDELHNQITDYSERYEMKKTEMCGLLVSDYYETLNEKDQLLKKEQETETRNTPITINEGLKKKILEYSERNFVPVSGVVSMSILKADRLELPRYESEERDKITTRIPIYLWEKVKREADKRGIPDSFYIEVCLNQAFNSPEPLFK
jgi:hypothetical protein